MLSRMLRMVLIGDIQFKLSLENKEMPKESGR